MIRWIAFDADDTLWENETYYQAAQMKLKEILREVCAPEIVSETLLKTETANIPLFGYGIKSFGLSMIETAIQLTQAQIPSTSIQLLLETLKEMVGTPPDIIAGVKETLSALKAECNLMVITKGDLLDQQRKYQNSGLAQFFAAFEVVNKKDEITYEEILRRYQIPVSQFMMVGNSLRSDVLPVVTIGAIGVLVQHELTWAHEQMINENLEGLTYYEIDKINQLPQLVRKINSSLGTISEHPNS